MNKVDYRAAGVCKLGKGFRSWEAGMFFWYRGNVSFKQLSCLCPSYSQPEQFLFIGHGTSGKGLPAAKSVEDNAWQESQQCHLPAQSSQKATVRMCPKSNHKTTGSRSFGSISCGNVTSYFTLHHLPFSQIIKIIYT